MPRSTSCRRCCLSLLLVLVFAQHAAAASGNWAILCDDNTCHAQGIPAEVSAKVAELVGSGSKIKSIIFTLSGGWAILYDKNGHASKGLPPGAAEKLAELAAQGVELKSIAVAPLGAWVILYDKNAHHGQDLPPTAAAKLNELESQGKEIKGFTFGRRGGWLVLFDKNGVVSENFPKPPVEKLNELAAEGVELKSFVFLPGPGPAGWFIQYDQTGYAHAGASGDVLGELATLAGQVKSIKSVSFYPDFIDFSQDDAVSRKKVLALLKRYKVPGLSIAVIDKGQIAMARGYGVTTPGGEPVTPQTHFQAGSVSKPVSAVGALRLVEQGKLTLDGPLNDSLTSWKIPANEFTAQKSITLRMALSHTAGFTVHGFPGYAAGDAVPTLIQVLDGKPPANTSPIVVDIAPGSQHRYSGGGYCVLQQAMIDVTGTAFPQLMSDLVLTPLNMTSSSFEQPVPAGFDVLAAAGHDDKGQPVAGKYHTYPEMAAAGLWTTPSDLARFVIGLENAAGGAPGAILRPETARQMFTPPGSTELFSWGYALGVAVHKTGALQVFDHNGRDEGFDTLMTGVVTTSQGAVIMINANEDRGLVEELMQSIRFEFAWPQ